MPAEKQFSFEDYLYEKWLEALTAAAKFNPIRDAQHPIVAQEWKAFQVLRSWHDALRGVTW